MGCSFSHNHGGDRNPRVFKVFNVDDQGQELSAGKMEITDTELILYQKNKDAIRWPLRSLRRYGFDAELFSFESGRRCPTGPGIYAFKCRRAEALFNLLQDCIQRAGQEEHQGRSTMVDPASRPNSFVEIGQSNGSVTQLQSNSAFHTPMFQHVQHPYINGSDLAALENGAGGPSRGSQIIIQDSRAHEYVNTALSKQPVEVIELQTIAVGGVYDGLLITDGQGINYAKLDLPGNQDRLLIGEAAGGATYINLATNTKKPRTSVGSLKQYLNTQSSWEDGPSYANIPHLNGNGTGTAMVTTPPLLTGPSHKGNVTYIQLDIKNSNDNLSNGVNPPSSPISLTPSIPESPIRKTAPETQSYATIDFNKTAALSNSAKGSSNNRDDGSRKTRHNSNIDELN